MAIDMMQGVKIAAISAAIQIVLTWVISKRYINPPGDSVDKWADQDIKKPIHEAVASFVSTMIGFILVSTLLKGGESEE